MAPKLPKKFWTIIDHLFSLRLKKRKLDHDIKQLNDTVKSYGKKGEDVVFENNEWYVKIRNTPRNTIIPANFLEKTDLDTLLKCCTINVQEAVKYLGTKSIEEISISKPVVVIDIKHKRGDQIKAKEA
jgi:hypothetical protein